MEYSEDPEYEPILASVDVSTQKSYCSFIELLQALSPIVCFCFLIMTCNSYIIIVTNYCSCLKTGADTYVRVSLA